MFEAAGPPTTHEVMQAVVHCKAYHSRFLDAQAILHDAIVTRKSLRFPTPLLDLAFQFLATSGSVFEQEAKNASGRRPNRTKTR
jgi:hypothetical protein